MAAQQSQGFKLGDPVEFQATHPGWVQNPNGTFRPSDSTAFGQPNYDPKKWGAPSVDGGPSQGPVTPAPSPLPPALGNSVPQTLGAPPAPATSQGTAIVNGLKSNVSGEQNLWGGPQMQPPDQEPQQPQKKQPQTLSQMSMLGGLRSKGPLY